MTDLTPPEPELTEFDMALRLCWAWQATNMERIQSCVQATRIGLEVLANLEIQARALPCAIVVRNAEAMDCSARGLPVADWPPSAWSVGIDPEAPPPGKADEAIIDSRTGDRGWNGHLIIEGAGYIIDLTANQFSRPLKNMELHAYAAPITSLDVEAGDNSWLLTRDNGVTVRIYPRTDLAAWRNGSAWRQDPPADAVTALTHLTIKGPPRRKF